MDKEVNEQLCEAADEDMDIYSVPKLYCTICLHDLNHPIYLPCTHPILSAPLCVICHEDVLQSDLLNELVEASDVCSWCCDGGDLLMCSDEEHCNRSFCKTCIENNFSADTLHAIESNDVWKCFCCDPTSLSAFKAATETAQSISLYNQPYSVEQEPRGDGSVEPTESNEQDQEIQRNLFLLQAVIEEGVEASNVHLQAKEELATWKAYWMRHFDILQVQEAALFETLYALDCDPRQFSEYTASYATLTSNLSSEERMALRSAEHVLLQNDKASKTSAGSNTSNNSNSNNNSNSSTSGSGKKKHTSLEYVEAVVEVDTDNKLPDYEALALTDPLVQQYANKRITPTNDDSDVEVEKESKYPEIKQNRYPQSFAAVVPKSVLHAYYHAISQRERRQLSLTYSIPPHIAIIMRQLSVHSSKEDFPYSTDRWSFANSVHPAVRLALYYSESATETAILCDHYQLPEDICRITEFGSTDEVISMYKKNLKARNTYNKTHNNSSEQMQFNTRMVLDAEEHEYEQDTSVLNDYIQVTSRSNTSSSSNGNSISTSTNVRTERIQSLLKPVIKDDTADIEKCQKERQKFINAIHGHTKGSKKKSSTSINGGDKDNHRNSSSTEQTSNAGVMESLLDLPVTSTSTSNDTASTTTAASVQDVTNTLVPLQEVLLEELPDPDMDAFDAGEEMEIEENNETEPLKGKEKHRGLSKREGRKKRKDILKAIAISKAAKQDSTTESTVSVPVLVAATTTITSPAPHSSIPGDNSSKLQTPTVNNYVITTPHTNNPSPAYFVDISEDSQLSAPPQIEPEQSSELRDMAVAMAESVNDAYPTSANKAYPATGRSNSSDAYDVIDLVSSDDEDDVVISKTTNTVSRSNTSASKALLLFSTPLEHASISATTKPLVAKQSTHPTSSHTTKPAHTITTTNTYTTTSGTSSAVADFFKPKPSSAIKKRPFHTLDSEFDTDDSATDDENNTGIKRQRLSSNKTAKSGTSSGKSKSKSAKDNMVWEKETLQVEEAEKKRLRALASYKHFKDDGFVLNENRPEGDPAVRVIQQFEAQLKAHQKESLRFMWDNVMGSVSSASSNNKDTNQGGGCILAHCMGLGKTLSVIALTTTLLAHPDICKIVDPYQPSADAKCAVSSALASSAPKDANTTATSTITGTDNSIKESEGTAAASVHASVATTSAALTTSVLAANPTLPSVSTMGLLKPPIHPSTLPSHHSAINKETKPTNPHISTTHHLLTIKPLIHTVLVIAPKNTLENWINEYQRWTPKELHGHTNVTHIMTCTNNKMTMLDRVKKLRDWYHNGGVMVMGYDMYRLLTNLDDKKLKTGADVMYKAETNTYVPIPSTRSVPQLAYVHEARLYLQYPGPDLVVADEAHIIKEKKSKISQLVNEIRTKRRIALTGSPLQNNLEEYWCMISFVKHRFLGAYKEFQKYYVIPIKKGSNADSSGVDKRRMKHRTHLLFKKLTPVVHRRDMSVLEADLLPKREFVISVKMTTVQCYMYKYFINLLSNLATNKKLLIGYNSLLRVWNHPGCVVMNYCKAWHVAERLSNKVIAANAAAASAAASANNTAKCSTDNLASTSRDDTPTVDTTGPITTATATASTTNTNILTLYDQLLQPNRPSIPTKPTLLYMREQLQSTLQHYLEHGSKVSDEMEQHASQMEDTLLNSNLNTTTPSKAKRDYSNSNSDNESDNDDSGSDLDGFIVDDDVVEYEDDDDYHNSEQNSDIGEGEDGEGKKRTRRSRRKLRRRVKKLRSTSTGVEEPVTDETTLNRVNSNASTTTLPLPMTLPSSRTATPVGVLKEDSSEQEDAVDNAENAALDAEIMYDEDKEDELTKTTIPIDWWKMIQSTETTSAGAGDIAANADASVSTSPTLSTTNNATSSNSVKSSKELHLPDDLSLLQLSNKMVTLLTLLMLSVIEGDKMLVFSQSIYSLDIIELFLNMPRWDRLIDCVQNDPANATYNSLRYTFSHWSREKEYLRIDGVSGNRQKTIDRFNNDPKHKLMLISTKAGNMGINLQAANRVVIFDTSWNPVHDLQAMYRAYRYGQKKSVFVYRLLSAGIMEEKIYRRQVTKQSLSARVVDAQMPDNHFTDEELMTFDSDTISGTLDKAEQVLQKGAGDAVLSRFIRYFGSDLLVSIEDHGGMLEDNIDEHLTAEEQALAVAELENEMKTALLPPPVPAGLVAGGSIAVNVVPGNSNNGSSSSSSGGNVHTSSNVDVSMNINIGNSSNGSNGSRSNSGSDSGSGAYNLNWDPGMQNLKEMFPTVFNRQRNEVPANVATSNTSNNSTSSNVNNSTAGDAIYSNSTNNGTANVEDLRAAQKLQTKCDQLIVFAQSASNDPTFALTLRLLKQILPHTHLTEADV
eukprot:gene11253-13095_t